MQPHRQQPTRLPRPWDSPGKNTGVGCRFLLQCVKVKSLSCAQLLVTPWTAGYQAPPSMGFSRQEYWSGVPLPSPQLELVGLKQKYGSWPQAWKKYKIWDGNYSYSMNYTLSFNTSTNWTFYIQACVRDPYVIMIGTITINQTERNLSFQDCKLCTCLNCSLFNSNYWESQFLGRLIRSPGPLRRRKGSEVLKEKVGVWNSQGAGKDKCLFPPLLSLVLVT